MLLLSCPRTPPRARMRALPLLLFSLLSCGWLAAAEDPRETADPSRWVEKAMQDGLTEVALGRIAQEKGTSAAIRAFGARMVADHSKANTTLASLAARKQFEVPTTLDSAHRGMVEEVSAPSGARFDALYSQHMITDHGRAIDLFTQATQGVDQELAAFARSILPVLKEHKRLADRIGAATGSEVKASSSNEKK